MKPFEIISKEENEKLFNYGNQPATSCVDADYHQLGITIREHFASMAMQGLCAGRTGYEQPGASAKYAVELADNLLKELMKK